MYFFESMQALKMKDEEFKAEYEKLKPRYYYVFLLSNKKALKGRA